MEMTLKNKTKRAIGLCAVLGAALIGGTYAVRAVETSPAMVTRTEILKTDMVGMSGYDGIMYVTTVGPGGFAPRHSHPGFEFNYVLKGSVTFQPDGEGPVTLKAGQAMFNPLGHIHKVSNASNTESATVVVVLVHQKGKPLVIPAE
jgi:quercetin dioxygenase-like cupin family protein